MPSLQAVNSPITKDSQLCISLAGRPSNFGTRFQNFLYHELGLPFLYKAFTTNDIEGAVRAIRALGIRGCAVSMPFKEAVIPYLDEIDPSAKRIGAVNTIVNTTGHLRAYNTDYIAVYQLLKKLDAPLSCPIALYGSGGMAKAIACALFELGYGDVTILARNKSTGESLAQTYDFKFAMDIRAFKELSNFKFLINVTPIGMDPNPENRLPFSEEWIANAEYIFDVIASPIESALIAKARALKKKTISGFEVVVIQGREQFLLYTNTNTNTNNTSTLVQSLSEELVKKAAEFARQI
jgi:shikimate dehydrogenase